MYCSKCGVGMADEVYSQAKQLIPQNRRQCFLFDNLRYLWYLFTRQRDSLLAMTPGTNDGFQAFFYL